MQVHDRLEILSKKEGNQRDSHVQPRVSMRRWICLLPVCDKPLPCCSAVVGAQTDSFCFRVFSCVVGIIKVDVQATDSILHRDFVIIFSIAHRLFSQHHHCKENTRIYRMLQGSLGHERRHIFVLCHIDESHVE